MTFPTELERLLKSYSAEKNAVERFRIGQQIDALLRNHADAILWLVRAAERSNAALNYAMTKLSEPYHWEMMKGKDPHQMIKAAEQLQEALAKLKEGK